MEHFDSEMKVWLASLIPLEKLSLRQNGFGAILAIKQICIESEFLDVCLERWDPDFHVFRFPFGEMCPLPEEFAAIGGWSPDAVPATIPLTVSHRSRFKSALFLEDRDMNALLVGGFIHMVRFVRKFSNSRDPTLCTLSRRRALCFCLMQRYLFAGMMTSSAFGDMRLMSIVKQMEGGRNCAHLILGETIYGLDMKKRRRDRDLLGCPRILQLWLMEHLTLLDAPANCDTYAANQIKTRPRSLVDPRRRPKGYFSNLVSMSVPRWVVPWWKITSFVGSSILQGHESVLLLGLDFGVWYHPLRVVRQMGRKQLIPSVGTCIKLPMAIGGLETTNWLFRWAERSKWRVPNVRATTSVSKAYSQ